MPWWGEGEKLALLRTGWRGDTSPGEDASCKEIQFSATNDELRMLYSTD
jgi:hypothetical protein